VVTYELLLKQAVGILKENEVTDDLLTVVERRKWFN
jgi:hypothetical protein